MAVVTPGAGASPVVSVDGSPASAVAETSSTSILRLSMLDQRVDIACRGRSIEHVMQVNFAAFATAVPDRPAQWRYVAHESPDATGFCLSREGQGAMAVDDLAALLSEIERDIVITLQRRRPDLMFVHAAALAHRGVATLLVAESGHGKSTTAWGLLHHGFAYLSDELSPVDLDSMQVHGYAHALCLKRPPPPEYPLPAQTLDLGRTLHVPVAVLPGGATAGPCEIGRLVFVRHQAQLPAPHIRPMSAAEASARLYVCTLNALAHPGHGLDAVGRVVERVPCLMLESSGLRMTCELLAECAGGVRSAP